MAYGLTPSPQGFDRKRQLTLSQTINFYTSKLKEFADTNFKFDEFEWKKVFQMSRKHCEKRRSCLLRAISPFPTLFSKGLYCRHVNTRACLGKG